MKKFCLAILIVISTTQFLQAQINSTKLLTKKPFEYDKTVFDIQLTANWNNPYLQEDVALDMLITSPSGKSLTLPCYYEQGDSGKISLWKARFAPQETGKYSYAFRLNKAGKTVNTTAPGSFYSHPSKRNGFLHIKNNWALQFDNGKPFRGLGEDIAWESRWHDDSQFFKVLHENPKYNYEYMLRSLAKHGGNFYRTWISSFNLPVDWQKGFNSQRYTPSDKYFNPSAIAKMDRLVTLSDSLGVYMMLTLGQGAYHTREGGFSPTVADFFVNPKSKERYKNRLRYFIARWGYSTSIGAWELFNEVDNVQFGNKNNPISADSIVQWHDEMSTYIKQTDPYNHLVTTSISHRDLKGLNSLPNMDFNQKHIYKNTASIPAAIVQYEKNFNKPYVIGEFGYEWDWSKNFDDFAEGMDSDFKRGLWYGLFSPTPVLPMSWWWEYFDNRGTDAYFLRVKAIQNEMLAAGNGTFEQVPVTSTNAGIITYSVKCGNKVFVYVFNPDVETKKIDLDLNVTLKRDYKTVAYDCETGKYGKAGEINISTNNVKFEGVELSGKIDKVFVITENTASK